MSRKPALAHQLWAYWLCALLIAWSSGAWAQLNCPSTETIHIGHGPARTMETWSGGGESLLFVGEGAVLTIYNIADPAAPVKLGEIGLSGPVWHIDVRADGTLAAVSDRRNTIRLVNISNRATPVLLASYAVPENRNPYGVAIEGNRLYAAIRHAGLAVIDITNPSNPALLAQVVTPTTDFAFDVEVRGNFAYLADDLEGVTIWNISNPSNPLPAGAYTAATGASHLLLDGNRLYVARRDQGFNILSIGTNGVLTLLGSLGEVDTYYGGVLVNGRLLTAGFGGLRAFNITNPASPQLISTFSSNVFTVAGLGNTAWMPVPGALRGISYATPNAPMAVASSPLIGPTEQVHASSTRIYAAQFPSGVAAFSNVAGSRGDLLGRLNLPGAYLVSTVGSRLLVASIDVVNNLTSLLVVDAGNPNAPIILATVPLNSAVYDIFVTGSRAFVATAGGVYVFDLSNPSAPVQLALWQGQFLGALAIKVDLNRAYMGFNDSVRIANISNVASPALLGQFALSAAVSDLELSLPNLYVADRTGNLTVLNVNNATAISLRSTHNFFPGIGYELARDGNALYIAAGPVWGTYIANISNVTSASAAGNYGTPDEVVDVAVTFDSVVAAENRNGIRITTCAVENVFSNGFE